MRQKAKVILEPIRTKRTERANATWYCCTRGYSSSSFVAAAGPALRVGNWRGRTVTVSYGGRSIRVKLVDWCACAAKTDHPRLIDLHPAAFAALAPLSRGVIRVTVRW